MKLIFLNKKHLNETAKGIEHKNQETLKENRAIEYKQTRIEFCYTWAGIINPSAKYVHLWRLERLS